MAVMAANWFIGDGDAKGRFSPMPESDFKRARIYSANNPQASYTTVDLESAIFGNASAIDPVLKDGQVIFIPSVDPSGPQEWTK
jgi:hypothetical protein